MKKNDQCFGRSTLLNPNRRNPNLKNLGYDDPKF